MGRVSNSRRVRRKEEEGEKGTIHVFLLHLSKCLEGKDEVELEPFPIRDSKLLEFDPKNVREECRVDFLSVRLPRQ